MAQLVITAAPAKLWPGGVISFRAVDWIGPSGATSEADARAIEGDVVRETQLTASVIRTAELTAFQNADDTLAIDVTGVGVNTAIEYYLYVSALIEGNWDTTSTESRRASSPWHFEYTARLGIYGDDSFPTTGSFNRLLFYPRNRSFFTMLQSEDTVEFDTGTEVLHIRALGGPSSTIEWLIDQVVLVPAFLTTTQVVGGAAGIFQGTPIVDGADGGDDNGKFTWHPRQNLSEDATDFSGDDGGGDYQQDDSEYMIEVPTDDGYFLDPQGEPSWAYGLHGPYHHEDETVVSDTFTRTLSPGWGEAGGGYAWLTTTPSNVTASVTGTQGKLLLGGVGPRDIGFARCWLNAQGPDTSWLYAEARLENLIYSGKIKVERTGSAANFWDGSTGEVRIAMDLQPGQTVDAGVSFSSPPFARTPASGIELDVKGEQWRVMFRGFDLSGWIDISAWFALQVQFGFRIEIRRHRVRARVWDAGGAEPGTWDFDDFMPIHGWPFAASDTDWDYSNDPLGAKQRFENWNPGIRAWGDGYIATWDVYVDDIEVEYDSGGDLVSTHALMENPPGTEVARIEIPEGAQHFVYWGARMWSAIDGFGDYNLDFSSKVWSDAGAADLQRAEVPFWWFRGGAELFSIVSMNWRSSERPGSVWRVLVGHR